MKVVYLIITFAITFGLMFSTSIFLDVSWIQNHWVRPVLIYFIMGFEFILGLAIMREIITQE